MRSTVLTPASRAASGIAAAVLALAFLIPAWGVIHLGIDGGRGAADQDRYHLKAIERFSEQWPRFEFATYESATTPGYHVIMAAVHRHLTTDVAMLRMTAALFTVGLLMTLGWVLARRIGVVPALALGAPLVTSLYVFSAGAWLLPDNAAWWCVLGVVLIVLRPRVDGRALAAAGGLLVVLVLFRQIHLWAAGLVWLAAWLGTGPNANPLLPLELKERFGRTARALAATLPAILIVGAFFWVWGGPVPKMFQGVGAADVTGINPATPALMLALVGIFATFYAPLLWPALAGGMLASGRAQLALALAGPIGILIALGPHTTYDLDAGRWSGLWNVVLHLEAFNVGDRSPLIIALAGMGAVWIVAWSLALNARDRWIFLGAWVAFGLAQSATHFSWQRYHEPFILIMFAVFATRLPGTGAGLWARSMQAPRWASAAWGGPVVLAGLLMAVTILSLRG